VLASHLMARAVITQHGAYVARADANQRRASVHSAAAAFATTPTSVIAAGRSTVSIARSINMW